LGGFGTGVSAASGLFHSVLVSIPLFFTRHAAAEKPYHVFRMNAYWLPITAPQTADSSYHTPPFALPGALE